MGIQISRLFFSCCCKVEDLGSRCSSTASSSPQHLLAQSPSSSSESREITSDPSCKLCLSEDNQRDTAVIYYRASVISLRPLALIIPNFLKPEECQALISLATPFLIPSRVYGHGLSSDRSSSSMFFSGYLKKHPAAVALQSRLHSLVNSIAASLGRSELQLTEALQVVKYSQGESYALHRDNEIEGKSKNALNRAATAIIYLNSIPSENGGGATIFPKASALLPRSLQKNLEAAGIKYLNKFSGVSVQPRQGQVLIFWSALPNGKEDLAALHEASPVLVGEKYIATHWFSE